MNTWLNTKNPPNCPHCGKLLDCHSEMNGSARPAEGSLSICYYCAELSIFTSDLQLRVPTEEEMREIKKSNIWDDIDHAQRALRITIKKI